MRVNAHAWLKVAQKGVCSVYVVSLRLALSTLITHPSSLLFPDGLFDTAFQHLTFTDLLPGLSRPKSAGPAHFRTGEEDFGYMANYATTQEVEMATSVDDSKSSRSTQGITPFPDFESLDARIASSLNKIIRNSYFKKKVSLEEQQAQKADRFLRGRQIAYLISDYFGVTGVNDSVLDYADLFSIGVRNDTIQEFDARWDEIVIVYGTSPT